jgi:hypothetical protein
MTRKDKPVDPNNLINRISSFINKIFDRLSKDKGLTDYLAAKGMVDSKRYKRLMEKRLVIRTEDEAILLDVITDIMNIRVNRRNIYIQTIKNNQQILKQIRINADKNASDEIKRKNKSIFRNNWIKYGFLKAFKYTKEYFTNIDLDKIHGELANYYLEHSNYRLMEKMIEDLNYEYSMEENIFILCVSRLYKKYSKHTPHVFNKINISEVLLPRSIDK